METTAPSLALTEHLLNLAETKGLVVENGSVLFQSDIGGGLVTHSWLTQREQGVTLTTEVLQLVKGSADEYEELLPAATSAPVDDEVAASVIERWGLLQQLEVSFDAQLAKYRLPRKTHDSDMANDNI